MIRRAAAHDYEAFKVLFPELGVDDPIPSRDSWLTRLDTGTWVAESDGLVVGFLRFEALEETGYVRNLVVAPASRRRGVARALLARAVAVLRAGGATSWRLNVMAENQPAISLYESMGMLVLYRATVTHFTWDLVSRLPSMPGAAHASIIARHQDATVEAAFALPSGQLAAARDKPGRVLVGLWSAGVIAMAVFDPAFPGAFPFRVAQPHWARALLEALEPYAIPGNAQMGVVVEDDDALAAMLVHAGATVRARVLHYHGPLPGS